MSTPPTFAVAGSVINSTGEAVAGATITISDTPGGTGMAVVADAAGRFSRKLLPGTWYLSAAGAGYNSAERRVVVSTANISGIDFTRVTRQPRFAGAYDGVALPVEGAPEPVVGLAGITVSRSGAFSGKLLLGGRAAPVTVRGVMDVSGVAQFGSGQTTDRLQIARPGLSPLTFAMRMDFQLPLTHQIMGTLSSDSAPVAHLVLNSRLYSATENPIAPLIKVPVDVRNPDTDNGHYTAVFNPVRDPEQGIEDSAYPQGDGWAVFTVRSTGAVSVAGELADGQTFTYTNFLSMDRVLPFYVARPGGSGSVSGRIQFRDVPGQSDADGFGLHWFKNATPRDAAYPQGWPGGIRVDFFASKFLPPTLTQKTVFGEDPVVAPAVNAVLSLSGGGLSGELANPLAGARHLEGSGQWHGRSRAASDSGRRWNYRRSLPVGRAGQPDSGRGVSEDAGWRRLFPAGTRAGRTPAEREGERYHSMTACSGPPWEDPVSRKHSTFGLFAAAARTAIPGFHDRLVLGCSAPFLLPRE